MQFPAARILIFAKAPVPGEVKTRLISVLGVEGAAQLHHELVTRTVEQAVRYGLAPVQLWCAPSTDAPLFEELHALWGVELHVQHGDDLGARMFHAFSHALQTADCALALGTDWPAMTRVALEAAFQNLTRKDDAAVIPAEDGGYVSLGLRRAEARLFSAMPWGSEQVMRDTRLRLQSLGWRWSELDPSWDLDRPEDYQRALRMGLLVSDTELNLETAVDRYKA